LGSIGPLSIYSEKYGRWATAAVSARDYRVRDRTIDLNNDNDVDVVEDGFDAAATVVAGLGQNPGFAWICPFYIHHHIYIYYIYMYICIDAYIKYICIYVIRLWISTKHFSVLHHRYLHMFPLLQPIT
jgi:hypothetical protein